MTKPLIPNNFKLKDDLIVRYRLDYFDNIEEYELDNGSFLYCIIDYKPDEDKIKKLLLKEIVYSGKRYWVLLSRKQLDLRE